jgi:hypothetical protein
MIPRASKAFRRCSALLVAAAIAPLAGAQTTWYVDVNGTPPGSGTLADPYTSIQYAIDQPTTVNLDTLSVAPGTYVENVTGSKQLFVIGSGAESCILVGAAPGPVVNTTVNLRELSGFTVTGGHGPGGDGIEVANNWGPTWANIIRDCLIVGNEERGIDYSGDTDGRVFDCTIADNGLEGWRQTGGSGVALRNTIVWNNGLPSKFSFPFGHPELAALFFYNTLENYPFVNNCNFGSQSCGNNTWDPQLDANYRLTPGSPCIDTGDPTLPLDPDGSPPDRGVFAYDPQAVPGPTVYCTSKLNSQGCLPAIGWTGSPSASGSPFVIDCTNVLNNKLGLMFYGYLPKALPYEGGTLCVSAPVKRTPVQDSGGNPPPDDCSGLYTYDFDALIQSGQDPNLFTGALVYAQFWYRDPTVDPFGTGRSDALTFLIQP